MNPMRITIAILMVLLIQTAFPQDNPALTELKQKADQGLADAQFVLASMYYEGEGVSQDYKEAVRWARLAADQGLADAQFVLGVMYAKGDGVPQDYQETLRWFRLAAEQGNAESQHNLGVAYANGEGVPVDCVLAHMWYSLAVSGLKGDESHLSVVLRDMLEGSMTCQEISEAQRLAREFAQKRSGSQ